MVSHCVVWARKKALHSLFFIFAFYKVSYKFFLAFFHQTCFWGKSVSVNNIYSFPTLPYFKSVNSKEEKHHGEQVFAEIYHHSAHLSGPSPQNSQP